jgi:hypothetical protein
MVMVNGTSRVMNAKRVHGCTGIGNVKKNVDPRPGSDSTQMRPPWRSMIRLQIASPIPVP